MIIKNELKLYCPKCKQIRNFEVNKDIIVESNICDEDYPRFSIDTNVNYIISITCCYCNYEIYHEDNEDKTNNILWKENYY